MLHERLQAMAGFHLGISSWGGSSRVAFIIIIIGNILGGKLGQFGGGGGGGGGVELFGGEASPAPPSLDETLHGRRNSVGQGGGGGGGGGNGPTTIYTHLLPRCYGWLPGRFSN